MAAAAAKQLTQADWDARALELAEQRGLWDAAEYDHCAYAGYDDDGYGYGRREVYRVRALTDARGYHLVSYDGATHRVTCDCTAASYGRPCGHAGSVLAVLARRGAALAAWLRAMGRRESGKAA